MHEDRGVWFVRPFVVELPSVNRRLSFSTEITDDDDETRYNLAVAKEMLKKNPPQNQDNQNKDNAMLKSKKITRKDNIFLD